MKTEIELIETPVVKANLVEVEFAYGNTNAKVQIRRSSLEQHVLDANLNYWEYPGVDGEMNTGYYAVSDFLEENLEMVVLSYIEETL